MPSWTSPRASARTLPISRVIARESRSLCWAISSPKRYRISPRFGAGVAFQRGSAISAALTAIPTSAAVPAWNRPMTSRRSAGFRLSNVSPGDRVDPFAGDEQLVRLGAPDSASRRLLEDLRHGRQDSPLSRDRGGAVAESRWSGSVTRPCRSRRVAIAIAHPRALDSCRLSRSALRALALAPCVAACGVARRAAPPSRAPISALHGVALATGPDREHAQSRARDRAVRRRSGRSLDGRRWP